MNLPKQKKPVSRKSNIKRFSGSGEISSQLFSKMRISPNDASEACCRANYSGDAIEFCKASPSDYNC